MENQNSATLENHFEEIWKSMKEIIQETRKGLQNSINVAFKPIMEKLNDLKASNERALDIISELKITMSDHEETEAAAKGSQGNCDAYKVFDGSSTRGTVNRKVLISGFNQDEDCLCVTTIQYQPMYDDSGGRKVQMQTKGEEMAIKGAAMSAIRAFSSLGNSASVSSVLSRNLHAFIANKKIIGVFYKTNEYASMNPNFFGYAENALSIGEWLESQGHQYIVTDDKEGPDCELDKHILDLHVLISTPFYPSYVTVGRMKKEKNLQLLLTTGIGSDHVDLNAALPARLTMAEVTRSGEDELMRILILVRNFLPGHHQVINEGWNVAGIAYRAYDLEGKTIGTIGAGRLGRFLVQRLKPFNCNLLYHDRIKMDQELENQTGAKFEEGLGAMLSICDIIVINMPLMEKTKGMFNKSPERSDYTDAFNLKLPDGYDIQRKTMKEVDNGVEIKGGEPLMLKLGDGIILHLLQVCLGEVKKGKGHEFVCLFGNVEGKKLVLRTISPRNLTRQLFDLVFDVDFELTHNWKNGSVFFYGYKVDKSNDKTGNEDESEFELEEDIPRVAANNGNPPAQVKQEKLIATEKANAVKDSAVVWGGYEFSPMVINEVESFVLIFDQGGTKGSMQLVLAVTKLLMFPSFSVPYNCSGGGATSFSCTEYQYVGVFMVAFAILIFLFLGFVDSFNIKIQPCTYSSLKLCKPTLATAVFSTIFFLLGAITSVVSGFLGMKIATYVNARTTLEARKGVHFFFITTYRSGTVMGFLFVAAVCFAKESSRYIVPRILFLDNYFICGDTSNWSWPNNVKMHVRGTLTLQAHNSGIASLEVDHVFTSETGDFAVFLSNYDTKSAARVMFNDIHYNLPPWSISMFSDYRNEGFNATKVGVQIIQIEKLTSKADGETCAEDLSSLDDSSTFTTVSLLEQIIASRDASDYLWYITSVDICSSEFFLQNGELPTLRVQSTGHALHVFINGQLSGSASRTGQNRTGGFYVTVTTDNDKSCTCTAQSDTEVELAYFDPSGLPCNIFPLTEPQPKILSWSLGTATLEAFPFVP